MRRSTRSTRKTYAYTYTVSIILIRLFPTAAMTSVHAENNIVRWLTGIGINVSATVQSNLQKEDVDLEAMEGLTDEDLRTLGFTLGYRSKIRKHQLRIRAFISSTPSTLTSSTQRSIPSPTVGPIATRTPVSKLEEELEKVKAVVAADPRVAQTIKDAAFVENYFAPSPATLKSFPWWVHYEPGKG